MKKDLTKTSIIQTILDIAAQIFVYIYEFIFVWEDDPYEGENFIENEKLKHSLSQADSTLPNAASVKNNATISIKNRQDFDSLKNAFGVQTADYIFRLKEEVDLLVDKHGLVRENTIMVVIPPEKMKASLLGPDFFENTLERIYSQYEKDVILKPGNIKILNTAAGAFYAEVQIESYTVTEETEYYPCIDDFSSSVYIAGIFARTWGHQFIFSVTNSSEMGMRRMISGAVFPDEMYLSIALRRELKF